MAVVRRHEPAQEKPTNRIVLKHKKPNGKVTQLVVAKSSYSNGTPRKVATAPVAAHTPTTNNQDHRTETGAASDSPEQARSGDATTMAVLAALKSLETKLVSRLDVIESRVSMLESCMEEPLEGDEMSEDEEVDEPTRNKKVKTIVSQCRGKKSCPTEVWRSFKCQCLRQGSESIYDADTFSGPTNYFCGECRIGEAGNPGPGKHHLRRRGPRSLVALELRRLRRSLRPQISIHSNFDDVSSTRVVPCDMVGTDVAMTPVVIAESFDILQVNIRGFMTHSAELVARIRLLPRKPGLVCLNETFLTKAIGGIELEGYILVCKRDRLEQWGGGIAIFALVELSGSVTHIFNSTDDERSWITLHNLRGPFIICNSLRFAHPHQPIVHRAEVNSKVSPYQG